MRRKTKNNNVNKVDIPGRYIKATWGDAWFYPNEPIKSIDRDNEIACIYQEIIKLSNVFQRALLRNKSFAEKLGLRKGL